VLGGIAQGIAALAAIGTRAAARIRAAAFSSAGVASVSTQRWDTIVVGAGVLGAWTAWHLRRKDERVLLLDAWGPAHVRASSGGESRITRTAYGRDEIYTRMAWDSLEDWRWLSTRAGLPVFHPIGVLFFFQRLEPYVTQTLEVHRRLKLPTEALERAELAKRFPQVNWQGIEIGLYERELGALMARRAVQTLVSEFVQARGEYATAAIKPPAPGPRLQAIVASDGQQRAAARFVFACGPWLPKLFPDLLGARIFPTRQEVFFFAPEAGDARFQSGALPVWADFNEGDIYYGMPDLEARGFKIAHDRHGTRIDPDTGDRIASAEGLADARQYLRLRFPDLAARPLVDARVCQYENSSNGDLLIDRHPAWSNAWLVGAGSGHAFKHGPAVGRLVANLVTGEASAAEPRFSLATKATVQERAVH
jgi:monomeric sarcosine oxidase